MNTSPIKRNEHIASLSREHHFSLLFGWKIKNGIKFQVNIERIAKYVDYFWKNNLEFHFKEEENVLFSVRKDPLIERALHEHILIKSEVDAIQKRPAPDLLQKHLIQVAELVTDHVRFEERTLFPHLEKILSPEELKAIGHELNEMVEAPLQDDYEDAFWMESVLKKHRIVLNNDKTISLKGLQND